ncbi:Hydantoinase/oxoprolinase [Haloechinothrix alba]|uniref:Hydantoinase/oxoprolinase n=1 Tax=Haloechinothrix alba TaxID=664784 RepID=A0A238Y5F8_9PSEU|nr:hydantoinase/oxoprolinase family protein [Haloechinothrix alba]SNR65814.1 Hydantoinase/oxoprolinase [Haloechinothrix alba]
MRIGIDVGGTNTDAVLLDSATVLAESKATTSADVTSGIVDAIGDLQRQHPFEPSRVRAVMIGTTHFINAIVEANRLCSTAVIRLGLPATAAIPPLVEWPERLVTAMNGTAYLCHGGHEFDGSLIAPLDRAELDAVTRQLADNGVRSVAISSVFSPVNAELEHEVASLVADRVPGVHVSMSHEIGRMGLLERENATIINASLRELADHVCTGLASTLAEEGFHAPLYLSQNDGTLMDVDFARKYPVATFASGPTNSMRGAAFLSGIDTCAVVDVGGTSSDVGILQSGFPREATSEVDVGGVRTNFRMPDVLSIGIGGGSRARRENGHVTVGPDSVGYRIREEALVFGGQTTTATDLAVAGGMATVGDPDAVRHVDEATVREGLALMADEVAGLVDRMRTSPAPLPVVLVGGGSIILPDELGDAPKVLRPDHYSVANAIGAAIAQIGGEVDRIFAVDQGRRDAVLDEAKQEAADSAVAAGAEPGTVEIVEVEEFPIAYLPGNATRIRVKAVGDLSLQDD